MGEFCLTSTGIEKMHCPGWPSTFKKNMPWIYLANIDYRQREKAQDFNGLLLKHYIAGASIDGSHLLCSQVLNSVGLQPQRL